MDRAYGWGVLPSIDGYFQFCFANCLETAWWANGACGDYYVNIQQTFSEKSTNACFPKLIVPKLWQSVHQLFPKCWPVSSFFATWNNSSPRIVAGLFNISKTSSEYSENARWTRIPFGERGERLLKRLGMFVELFKFGICHCRQIFADFLLQNIRQLRIS